MAAKINRGNFGLYVKSVDVFLDNGKQGIALHGAAVLITENFCKNGGGSWREQLRGKAVGPAVGIGVFGGIAKMPLGKPACKGRIEEGTVGPGKIA